MPGKHYPRNESNDFAFNLNKRNLYSFFSKATRSART
jgi:hypothetical protein